MSILLGAFTVLKVVLKIILILLLIILVLLALILFVPIRYQGNIIYTGGKDVSFNAKVTYLGKLVNANASFDLENGLSYIVKILFFELLSSGEDSTESEASTETEDNQFRFSESDLTDDELKDEILERSHEMSEEEIEDFLRESATRESADYESDEDTESSVEESNIKEDETNSVDVDDDIDDEDTSGDEDMSDDEDVSDDDRTEEKRRFSPFRMIKSLIDKFINLLKSIYSAYIMVKGKAVETKDKIAEVGDKVTGVKNKVDITVKKAEKFKQLYETSTTKDAIELVKKCLISILKNIRPKRLEGHAYYGFEDPSLTGEVLAVISILYPIMDEHFSVVPYFDHEEYDINALIKGRIHLIVILVNGLKLFFSKKIRVTIDRFNKIKAMK